MQHRVTETAIWGGFAALICGTMLAAFGLFTIVRGLL